MSKQEKQTKRFRLASHIFLISILVFLVLILASITFGVYEYHIVRVIFVTNLFVGVVSGFFVESYSVRFGTGIKGRHWF